MQQITIHILCLSPLFVIYESNNEQWNYLYAQNKTKQLLHHYILPYKLGGSSFHTAFAAARSQFVYVKILPKELHLTSFHEYP